MGRKVEIEELERNDQLSDLDKTKLLGGKKGSFDPGLAGGKAGPGDDARPSKRDDLGVMGTSHPSEI